MEVLDLSRPKSSLPTIQNQFSTTNYMDPHMFSISTPHHLQWQYHHHQHSIQQVQGPLQMPLKPLSTPECDLSTSPINSTECDLPQASPVSSTGSSTDLDRNIKSTVPPKRPFKMISSITKTAPLITSIDTDIGNAYEYEQFRKKVLSQFDRQASRECNKNMRRTIATNAEKSKDPEYIEKRKKNNEAAKRSREARKAREDELAIRVAFLEQENMKLKFQLALIERQKKIYKKQAECV